MDWNNVNLNSNYEKDQDLLDSYNFDTLLLEVSCNCAEINADTVRKQAMYELDLKYKTAVGILEANLDNIVAHAQKQRNAA